MEGQSGDHCNSPVWIELELEHEIELEHVQRELS